MKECNRQANVTSIFLYLIILCLTACGDSAYSEHRDHGLELKISNFYSSKESVLNIEKVTAGNAITGFCVLEPYEDRVSDKDNRILQVNEFLNKIGLAGDESYWNVVMQTDNGFMLLRMNNRKWPMKTPKEMLSSGKSCSSSSPGFSIRKSDSTTPAKLVIGA